MRTPSGRSSEKRRTPQRPRGERRVAEVLDAAAQVLAERGYEAATMTEIALRANISAGTAYQYFADKEALFYALDTRYAEEMAALWPPLRERVAALGIAEFADALVDALVGFMMARPAYLQLLNAPVRFKRPAKQRFALRESFEALLRELSPGLSIVNARRITTVTLKIIMTLPATYAGIDHAEQKMIAEEFRTVLRCYLTLRLKPQPE
ncbi:TetR/AcrR family transcriptional regulator [Terriglobus albidus]|uniref:TetR/AcrR family transcriptional regulator n=1 Tax=Terriglobus albidus TaxID=1592106 RepID=A0A5B9EFB0_9BACT|nr:TetR/AcrR family transcriptional regulator [Terriglobus albidus]QEE30344.1 TetR/AcrR family transcriptional regulator [Terriglobus albidus]